MTGSGRQQDIGIDMLTAGQSMGMQRDDRRHEIRLAQLDLLYRHAGVGMVAVLVAVIMLAAVFQPNVPMLYLAGWAGACIASIAVQYYLRQGYLDSANTSARLEASQIGYIASVAMTGLLWGGSGLVLVPETFSTTDPVLYTAIAAVFAGVVAVSMLVTQAASLAVSLAFIVPCLAPMGVAYAAFGHDEQRLVGVLLLLLLAFLIWLSIRLNRIVLEWITAYVERGMELQQLESKYLNAVNTNDDLRQQLAARTTVEEELRSQKGKADSLADQLKALSSRDGLTGISNRRYFDDFLNREWNRALRNNHPIALILCDIDYFKNYNDVYGHQKGDQCLKNIARTLNSFCRRGSDLCARYGGEEFAIVLGDTDIAAAYDLAESIRQAVYELKIPHCASEVATRVTMSFGVVSMMPDREAEPTQLIQMADAALYQAKANGRNTVADALVEEESPGTGFLSVQKHSWNTLNDGEFSVDSVLEKFNKAGFRCNLQYYEPDTTMGRHASMRDEIYAVIDGRLSITIDGEEFILKAGDYILLPRGVTRRTIAVGDKTVQVLIAIRNDNSARI